jgi:hypothetical protein
MLDGPDVDAHSQLRALLRMVHHTMPRMLMRASDHGAAVAHAVTHATAHAADTDGCCPCTCACHCACCCAASAHVAAHAPIRVAATGVTGVALPDKAAPPNRPVAIAAFLVSRRGPNTISSVVFFAALFVSSLYPVCIQFVSSLYPVCIQRLCPSIAKTPDTAPPMGFPAGRRAH